MILKKNFRQVSFLHVYHHSSIFAVWWLVVYMAPNGDAYFSATLNSFVHVIMYGYYYLSAMGFKEVSFVKYYITKTQMTQFVLNMLQSTWNVYVLYRYPNKEQYPASLNILLWVTFSL